MIDLLNSKCELATDLLQQLESDLELEFGLQDTIEWDIVWFVDFYAGKTQLVSLTGLVTPVLLM